LLPDSAWKALTFVTLSFQGESPAGTLVPVGRDASVEDGRVEVALVPVVVGGWRAGEVGESVDALRLLVGFTRHHCFVVAAARFLLNHLSASAGKVARLSDILISRARLVCTFAKRPARSCGEPSAATEDAASRYEKVTVVRYIVRCQQEKGWGKPRGVLLLMKGDCA